MLCRARQGRGLRRAARQLVLLVAATALLPTGCMLRPRSGQDPVQVTLDICRLGLVQRPRSSQALDGYVQCLLDTDVSLPDEARVHGALAQAYHLRALSYPVPGRDDLATARTWALTCLTLQPGVAGRLQNAGGQLTRRPLQAVPAADVDCLVWATMSWSRWLWQRDVAGAAIDLEPVSLLAERAIALAPDYDDGRAWWALGLAQGIVPPALGRDGAAARTALTRAIEQNPARLLAVVDHAELILGPGGEHTVWQRSLERVAKAPEPGRDLQAYENAAARERAAQLLEAGPPPASRW